MDHKDLQETIANLGRNRLRAEAMLLLTDVSVTHSHLFEYVYGDAGVFNVKTGEYIPYR